MPPDSFRCVLNCVSPASTSSRISVRTDCSSIRCPTSFTYRWKMFKNNGSHPYSQWTSQTNFANLLATEVGSKNLVIKEQSLAPGSSYRITVDVLSPDDSVGWAAYQFDTLAAPSGGTCRGTQLDRDVAGVWLNITCHGWRDESMPLSYEFYHELEDGEFDMLSYGVWSYSVIHIPPSFGDVVRFKVAIVNVVGTASEIGLSIKVCIIGIVEQLLRHLWITFWKIEIEGMFIDVVISWSVNLYSSNTFISFLQELSIFRQIHCLRSMDYDTTFHRINGKWTQSIFASLLSCWELCDTNHRLLTVVPCHRKSKTSI